MTIPSSSAFEYHYRALRSRLEGPIRFTIGQTVLGMILVGRSRRGVCAIFLGKDAEDLQGQLREAFPGVVLLADETALERELNWVIAGVSSVSGLY